MEVKNNTLLAQIEEGTPGSRIIRLRSIYKTGIYKSHNTPVGGTVWVQPKKHPTNANQFLGVDPLSDFDKQKVAYYATGESLFELKDGVEFDLDDEMEAMTWKWVRHSDVIATDFDECQSTPAAQFYLERDGVDAENTISHATQKAEAYQLVLEDSVDMLPYRAELLGAHLDGMKSRDIRAFLFDMIETRLDKVLEAYKDKDINYKIFIRKALKAEVIVKDDLTGFYQYGNSMLGTTVTSVIATLKSKEHKEMAKQIEAEVEKLSAS